MPPGSTEPTEDRASRALRMITVQGGVLSYDCPANSTSPARNALPSNCDCIAGYVGPDGDPCDLCPVNKYCVSGDLSVCSTHAVWPPESDELTDCFCIAGYFGENGEACTKCTQTSARYGAVEPKQWLQCHPEAGSSWPS